MNNITVVMDHLVWAVPDLDLYVKEFETTTGIKAIIGGSHPDHGTRNALISMGEGEYFELLARDNSLPAGKLAKFCTDLTQPNLVTWVVRTNNIPAIAQKAESLGYQATINQMSRVKPNGERLQRQLLWLSGHEYGTYIPLVIDWQNSRHPSLDAPAGLKLTSFTIEAINPKPLEDIFAALSIPVNIKTGLQDCMIAQLQSPKGQIELTGVGLKIE
jgi:hypothetical protein